MQCVVSIVPRAVAHRGQFPMILASSSMAHLPKNHSKMHENGLWRKIFFACGALIRASGRLPHGRDVLSAKIGDPGCTIIPVTADRESPPRDKLTKDARTASTHAPPRLHAPARQAAAHRALRRHQAQRARQRRARGRRGRPGRRRRRRRWCRPTRPRSPNPRGS